MNRRQMGVLCIGILVLVEWYLATNIDYSIWILIAVGAIAVAVMGGLLYMLRDKEKFQEDDKGKE